MGTIGFIHGAAPHAHARDHDTVRLRVPVGDASMALGHAVIERHDGRWVVDFSDSILARSCEQHWGATAVYLPRWLDGQPGRVVAAWIDHHLAAAIAAAMQRLTHEADDDATEVAP